MLFAYATTYSSYFTIIRHDLQGGREKNMWETAGGARFLRLWLLTALENGTKHGLRLQAAIRLALWGSAPHPAQGDFL